ncbi:MAG TPA: POTRA domain-containing protein [Candidatus Dormibacteraeota bacterium]|nr:POTRA domain-containing protein [Candidatus Dormibacteraeota bacterium]
MFSPAFANSSAQTPASGSSTLHEIHVDGFKKLTEPQIIALTELQPNTQVDRDALQVAADKLVRSGLFAHVKYDFHTRGDQVTVNFHVEENALLPAFFDNIPWFDDSELAAAIKAKDPAYDGTLPESGPLVDAAADTIKSLLASRKLDVTVEHQVMQNPIGEGNVQSFAIEGASLQISSIEFGDPSLDEDRAVQAHLGELRGKPYSRLAIDIFLTEQVRPGYLKKGYLRLKLGPPQVRLTGAPTEELPDKIPVYIPVEAGAVYHFTGVQWSGNSLLKTDELNAVFGLKPNDTADGEKIFSGWDRVQEEYGRRGYLETKIEPVETFDDSVHTVSYQVKITEGAQFKMGSIVLTGISVAADRRIHETFPVQPGELFDKSKFETYLSRLQNKPAQVFGDLPVHYENVGHWLRADPAKGIVDVLLDFK